MKNIFKSIIVAVAISTFSMTPKVSVAQDPDQPVTLQTFYDQLAPYGQWINYPNYGYVFIPNAGPGFIPYSTAGHWEYTDQFGWTWSSDYPWGWACFHYGRWNYDPSYGWFWVPDVQWGPAWVVWRNSPQYYGWAPLPSGVDINGGMNNGYGISPQSWCFVPNQYMGDPMITLHFMPRINNDIFLANSAIIFRINFDNGHRYNYFAGPDRFEVERYRHQPIQPVMVTYNSDPHYAHRTNELTIYRPSAVIVHDDGHHDDGHHDDGHHDDGHHDDHHDAPAPVRVVQVQQVPQRGYNPGNNNHGNDNHGGDNHGNDNHGNNGGNNRGGNNQGNNNGGNNGGGNDHHGHH